MIKLTQAQREATGRIVYIDPSKISAVTPRHEGSIVYMQGESDPHVVAEGPLRVLTLRKAWKERNRFYADDYSMALCVEYHHDAIRFIESEELGELVRP